MSYNEWIAQVDALLVKAIGVSHDDLEDYLWHDDFEDGLEPVEAVDEFLFDQGYYGKCEAIGMRPYDY